MTLLFADLSGIPVVRAVLAIPFAGIWHADVELDRALGPEIVGPQILTLAGSTWACAPIRAVDFTGERRARLVGGTAGWRTEVAFQEFQSPSGVPTSLVVSTVAGQVQEIPPVLAPTVPATVGAYWCIQADRASLVLEQVLGKAWWMDATGTIQTALRPPTPIATPFTAISVDGVLGRYEIATEFPATWLPGSTFLAPNMLAPGTVSRVVHILDKGSLRTEVLSWP